MRNQLWLDSQRVLSRCRLYLLRGTALAGFSRSKLASAAVSIVLVAAFATPASADGGNGGNGGGTGGFDGSIGHGGQGGEGIYGWGGGGGGAGVVGGAGGAAMAGHGTGSGGAGGNHGYVGTGLPSGALTGTDGLRGGDAYKPAAGHIYPGGGGGGGAGGYGAVVTGSAVNAVISHDIIGGNGGDGGSSVVNHISHQGGSGGSGGRGLHFTDGTQLKTITVSATIRGGNGGAGGASGNAPPASNGWGGIGIFGSNLAIINRGTIAGGLAADGSRFQAVIFSGGVNLFEVHAGSSVAGNVAAFSTADTLRLGGTAAGTFDASLIGSTYHYFGVYEVAANSDWTLTGTATAYAPWKIAGRMTVGSDASLGHPDTLLTLAGGTLATTASFTSARSVSLVGNGRFDPADGTTLTLTGQVGGPGTLVKQGDGTLVLASANTYGGGTTIYGGAVSVSADNNLGDVAGGIVLNSGTLQNTAAFTSARDVTVDPEGRGTFLTDADLTLSGKISGGGFNKDGAATLTLTGDNAGYGGNIRIRSGTLEIGNGGTTGSLGSGDVLSNGTLAFNRSNDFSFGAAIMGNGNLVKKGTGELTLTGTSTYGGATTVRAGTLRVNGSIAGSGVDVQDGATLAGSGTVGSTVVAAGGRIAPGNGIGTLTVAGDLTINGGHYDVEVDPQGSASDLIKVGRTATLNGGSVVHVGAGGKYRPNSTYTILTAGQAVFGKFGSVSSNFAFLNPALSYNENSVALKLTRNDTDFSAIGSTRNQVATGAGAESLRMGNKVYDAILPLDAGSARKAFEGLSGEVHASLNGALIDDSRFMRDATTDRIRAAFEDVAAVAVPVTAYGPDGAAIAAAATDSFAGWGRSFGAWGSFDSDGNAAEFSRSTGGLLVGGDAAIGTHWRAGMVAGYSKTSFDVDARASSGDSDNYHLGLYGGGRWGTFGIRVGAGYSLHSVSTTRTVAFDGFAERLTADYNTGTAQLFGEAGYRLDTAVANFEPFAGLAHVSVRHDAFAEQGGAAALHSVATTNDVTFATLGLRAAAAAHVGGIEAAARGMIGWRHAFGDVTPYSALALAGGNAFTIGGTPIARDALVLEAGLDVAVSPNTKFGLGYNGQIASNARDHAVKADLTVKF